MTRKLFVNLAVEDLPRARDFWQTLGFTFDEQFSSESGACMVVSEAACVMLLTHGMFSGFTTRPIADTTGVSEGIFAISCDSRAAVDEMVGLALANGARPAMPAVDHGFMYGWSFYCPDGHHWEPFWMDANAPDDDDEEGEDA